MLLGGYLRAPWNIVVGPPAVLSRRATAGGGIGDRKGWRRGLPLVHPGVGNRVPQSFHRRGGVILLGLRWLLLGLGNGGSLEEPAGRGCASRSVNGAAALIWA